MSPVKDLHIRREYRPNGWALIFTGKAATDFIVEDALDEIEKMFAPVSELGGKRSFAATATRALSHS